MKKIINGKKYDTETAQEMGTWSNAGSLCDFSHMEETLYRKKTGEYFLFGEGGPMTKYAVSEGNNSWSGGSDIVPLTYDAAQEWAEKHLEVDKYEEIFGEVEEDESKTTVTFRLTVSTVERMKRNAAQAGIGMSEYLESVLK